VTSLVALAGALFLVAACGDFEFPSGTCSAAGLNAGPTVGASLDECTSCLVDPLSCDAVGRCGDTPGCEAEVHEAHRCILAAGLRAADQERACTAGLTTTFSRDAYAAMRGNCGTACRLPVCRVDPAAVQFASPACDKCVSGACCEVIDACYANRTCKLTMECIARCQNPFEGGAVPSPSECADAGAIVGGGPPTTCVARCIYDFRDHEQLPAPGKSAQCLAFAIQSCALTAGCGSVCDAPLAAPDAGAD